MSRQSVASKAFHYIYEIRHPPTGYYYVGVSSSDDPEMDKYMGSGVKLKAMYRLYPKKEWTKTIVKIFTRRCDADHLEGVMVSEATLRDEFNLNSIKGISR